MLKTHRRDNDPGPHCASIERPSNPPCALRAPGSDEVFCVLVARLALGPAHTTTAAAGQQHALAVVGSCLDTSNPRQIVSFPGKAYVGVFRAEGTDAPGDRASVSAAAAVAAAARALTTTTRMITRIQQSPQPL